MGGRVCEGKLGNWAAGQTSVPDVVDWGQSHSESGQMSWWLVG